MPYKSRFACCSVCCSCSISLLLGYVGVNVFTCLSLKHTKREQTLPLCSAVAYFTERTRKRIWSSKKNLLIRRVRFLQNLAILRTGMVHHLHKHKTAPSMDIYLFQCSYRLEVVTNLVLYRCMCSQLHESTNPHVCSCTTCVHVFALKTSL